MSQAVLTQGGVKLQQLNSLRDQLVGGAKDVTALRAEIASAVADIRAYTSQVGAATGATQGASSEQAAQIALREASAASRKTVDDFERDFYERRIFDPYLRFASATDEETYRQNEAERRREIEKARAEHTPEGDLRAVNLSIDQLRDAGAHGADRSREFKPHLDALYKSSDALTSAIGASQRTTRQQVEQGAPAAKDTPDPLASVGAKSPDAKGAVAVLIAAGLSGPQSDNLGHGVANQAVQPATPTRAI